MLIQQQGGLGFEFRKSTPLKAMLDTGASFTVVSKTWARNCKLFQTSPDTKRRVLGGTINCGEHAGSISFPGTNLRALDPVRIVSADFHMERNFACLIGTDILRNWKITFDGESKLVTIED
ncbi:MAG: retroviral-like aspartic protease family protein [Acidobacteriaceae bacterium]